MARINYLKDTTKFWQERKEARRKLDNRRASAPHAEKMATMHKVQADVRLLEKGRIISVKPSPKPSKT